MDVLLVTEDDEIQWINEKKGEQIWLLTKASTKPTP